MTGIDTVDGTVYRVGMRTPAITALDAAGLDLLAYDIADLLDRHGYDPDVADCDLRPHLEAFLAAAKKTAAEREVDEPTDAASWSPTTEPTEPVVQYSRRPRMTYMAWWRSQTVDLGATAVDEWYWSCPKCKAWAGPYPTSANGKDEAKKPGMDHVFRVHDLPAARAAEDRRTARKAARS